MSASPDGLLGVARRHDWRGRFAAAVLALAAGVGSMGAATLYWDGDGAGVVDGGTGTWDTTLARWSTTAGGNTYAAWDNATNDDAVFQNTAGTVTIGAPVTAQSITFGVSGYTLSGASAITLAVTGIVDTGAFDATISAPFTGALGLVKNGTGMLTLGGTNTYTGTTSVTAGTLRLNGAIAAASTVVIQTGGTIAGTGTIGGPLRVAENAFVAPGAGGIGTLSMGEITWHGSSTGTATALFELGAANASDRLAVTGLFEKGTGTSFRFDFQGTGVAGSVYTLATFGSTTFVAADFSHINLAPGMVGAFTIVGGTLRFTTTGPPVISSSATASGAFGGAFSYTITASNSPTSFSIAAGALPAGLALDTVTGVISGTLATAGTFNVTLGATNAAGTGTAPLTITIAPRAVSVTLSNLSHVYDGTVKQAIVTTNPPGVALNPVLYLRGSTVTQAPIAAGSYMVLASTAGPAFSGSAVGTFTILPAVTTPPVTATAAIGTAATFSTVANGGGTLSYQWRRNGADIAGATNATLSIANVQPADAGLYSVVISIGGVSVTTAAVPLEIALASKVAGTASEVGANISHPNGNIYDQILLSGPSASVRADAGQLTRVSFVDLNDDIVQVEFSGPGVLSISLENATGPAVASKYNQPSVLYMKGHATLTITGADERTNISVFSVGSATAINQAHFRAGTIYDGWADIAHLTITSRDGRFGGVRTANVTYFHTRGVTGVSAPGVQFTGPLWVGDISGSDTASAVLLTGSVSDARITGGDLLQANGGPVAVSGMTTLQFTTGTDSHGRPIPAQPNRARLLRDGVDVTAELTRQ